MERSLLGEDDVQAGTQLIGGFIQDSTRAVHAVRSESVATCICCSRRATMGCAASTSVGDEKSAGGWDYSTRAGVGRVSGWWRHGAR